MLCKGHFKAKNNAKCRALTMFTEVHMYTGRFWRLFIEHSFNKIHKKVIKKSEIVNISEHIGFTGRFLPCSFMATLRLSVLQKRLGTPKYTDLPIFSTEGAL